MHEIDVSIIIVHAFSRLLVRQTLRGIRRAAPKLNYEVIIIDNTPGCNLKEILNDFPEVRYQAMEKNIGFGSAMNVGIRQTRGKYILIFSPDIIAKPGSLEELKSFMDENEDVGMVGPKLLNPDGSLQNSCYRIPTFMIPAYRRTFLGRFNFGRRAVEDYLMIYDNHDDTMEVDSLIGAALFTRRSALDKVGLFDEQFFMYYEDNDLCRRFWENGYKVIYHPKAQMVHYHRRISADGKFLQQLTSRFTWIQIASALKFFKKYRKSSNPRQKLSLNKEVDV